MIGEKIIFEVNKRTEEINKFTQNVFELYDGRINIVNTPVIAVNEFDIKSFNDHDDSYQIITPNLIVLNIFNIAHKAINTVLIDKDIETNMKYWLWAIIVYSLYIIDSHTIEMINDYDNEASLSVITKNTIEILSNDKDANALGLDPIDIYEELRNNPDMFKLYPMIKDRIMMPVEVSKYKHTNLKDHMLLFIHDLLGGNKLEEVYDLVEDIFDSNTTNVFICDYFNNRELLFKSNSDEYTPIGVFNTFMNNLVIRLIKPENRLHYDIEKYDDGDIRIYLAISEDIENIKIPTNIIPVNFRKDDEK